MLVTPPHWDLFKFWLIDDRAVFSFFLRVDVPLSRTAERAGEWRGSRVTSRLEPPPAGRRASHRVPPTFSTEPQDCTVLRAASNHPGIHGRCSSPRSKLGMESFSHKLNSHFEHWIGPRDPRVRGWLLLDNYLPTFTLTVVYLLIVWMGPKYMRDRQPYSCRGLLLGYNVCLTLLSLHMFSELIPAVWHGHYNLFCQNTYSAPEVDNKVMKTLWWYYFSKLIEFMDTFFFILRKNNHQITFLHIYHHASMFSIWWFVMNWIPCGHSFFGAMLNSFIHVVMYSYYGLSSIPAMRPYLWWKKYLTQLQLIQFFLTVSHTMCAIIWSCGFPIGWTYFQICYMFTLIFLFINFYFQTYKKLNVSSKEHQDGSQDTQKHGNGTESHQHKKLRMD